MRQTSNTQLVSSYFVTANQSVSDRIGVNAGSLGQDNSANFWSHFGGNISYLLQCPGLPDTLGGASRKP